MTGATAVVAAARDEVARLADEAGIPLERDAAGDFLVPFGSTTVYVQVSADETANRAVLDVWAPVIAGVHVTPELVRVVAETSFLFGRLTVERGEGGLGQVVLTHPLLAEPLTTDVLLQVVGTIAHTADDLDDELAARFGRHDGRAV